MRKSMMKLSERQDKEINQMGKSRISAILIFLLVLGLGFTSSCSLAKEDHVLAQEGSEKQEQTTALTSNSQSEKTMPTGYSDGGIGFASIFYDGQLFQLEEIIGNFSGDELCGKLLELNAEKVGTIITETNYRWPSVDLEASRIPVSQPVYYDHTNRLLYSLFDDGSLRLLKPYQGLFYQLDNKQTNPSSIKTSPTGYSDGGIGFASIYYNHQLFYQEEVIGDFSKAELSGKIQELGAEKVGTVIAESNHRWPSLDLEASRIQVGSSVYYDQTKNLLYVVDEDGNLRLLKPYLEELYDLEPNK